MHVELRVRLREEGTGTAAEGRVVRLSPAVDEGTRTLMVEAEIPNESGRLRPGAFATADIVVDPEQTAILLPASSIVTFAGVTKVVTVADGKAVEKRVTLGRKAGDRVEVTAGLAAGESVVAEPGSLSAGQAVVVE
jgi:RND family efflux transporter MFP subunit